MIDFAQLRSILLAGSDVFGSDTALIPKDMALQSLEPFQSAPNFFKGTFSTGYLSDFIAYLQHYIVADSACGDPHAFSAEDPHAFIDDTGPTPVVHAVIDHGLPGEPLWRHHTATLAIAHTEAFAALNTLLGKTVAQRALLDFIDDYGDLCVFHRPDGATVAAEVARGEFANLTAEKVRQINSQRGDFKRELSEVERLSLGTGLPNRLTLTAAPWRDFTTQNVRVRISAADSGSGLGLDLRLIGWDAIQDALIAELVAALEAIEGLTVRRGVFSGR